MIISVINQKGGVGKTTITHNIGFSLVQLNKKVLLIDLDPQADLSFFVGVEFGEYDTYETDQEKLNSYGVNGIFKNHIKSKKEIKKLIFPLKKNIDIIPSFEELAITENKIATGDIFKNAIDLIKNDYDYILVDCPPHLGMLTASSIVSSDGIIIPTKTDYLSYRKIDTLIDNIEYAPNNMGLNNDVDIIGVVANFYKSISNDDKAILKNLKENYNVLGVIKDRVKIKSGVYDSKSIVELEPKSETAKEFNKIAKSIINWDKETVKKKSNMKNY